MTGVKAQTGHKVSNSNIKTKRKFLPNMKSATFKSDVLNINVRLRLAAKTIRSINKYGGLDSFLVNYGYNKLSENGRKLRQKVRKRLLEQDKLSDLKILKKKVI